MTRLFAGRPIRSSGNLDIVTIAQEAGVKRNKLTHKHTDLRDACYAERARRDGVTEREIKLREQANDLTRRLNEIRQERDNYRENTDLRKQLDKATSSNVTPPQAHLTGRHPPLSHVGGGRHLR